uniref:uncharacterized protein LOC109962066 isoform X2 n=1 Tax=Monopterus albus TaxID=43700 RepID=UPI0009B3B223|nr:uncharacterized protein LOC109962066 isoform X2 [Monopterus albus]
MDACLQTQLNNNHLNYKRSLDRIIDKYSKLQYQDEGVEVDLKNTEPQILEYYMNMSEIELNNLDSKSLTDLREESLSQDISRNSQLDFTHQDGSVDKTHASGSQFSVEEDGMARSNMTQLTVSSLGDSHRNTSETELQPEDQDEELEMTLRCHGSSFVELYPSMISRIKRAWHRKNVSEAAGSVLRRYRRWRQQLNRSHLNNTFDVRLRHTSINPKKMTKKTLFKENSNSPERRQLMKIESAPRSPLQMVNNLRYCEVQQYSPGRERCSQRRERHQPIIMMDASELSEASKPKEILNKTFTVSELGEQPSTYTASLLRPSYPTAKASLDRSLRTKRLSLSAHSKQTGCSSYPLETTAVKERPDFYSSPVRQGPLNARMMNDLSKTAQSFSRSPKEYSTFPLSSPQKPAGAMRILCPQVSHHSLQPHLHSPQSGTAEGRLRLRRHLSFDSSQPSVRVLCSPKKLDEDFKKLYHKFVCQNKSSSFNGPPCRLCATSSEASSGHYSSALAALALSPHRFILRKRHRELGCVSQPQSKRSREEYCMSSPGSKRHGKELLRRCLSLTESEDLSFSSSKYSMFQKFSQRSADAHQEAGTSQGQPSEFFALRGSFEKSAASSYSPRKW